ncbi:MAG TPA: chemotaxis protein CheW [Beijerinckiaceae bacterium]|nr:chemotaxis protein CheW [Beijerinckiaceae bacterium]
MDELLKDFLVESAEHIESVANELVQFERDPTDARIIASIFRLVHTVKGTCGFLSLPRLARLAHTTEALIGRLRDGAPATHQRVSLILAAIDRIKFILAELESNASEPHGDDADLIAALDGELGPEPKVQEELEAIPLPQPVPELQNEIPVGGNPAAPQSNPDSQRSIRGPATIRVSVTVLERIMTLVSELVLTRNQLREITRRLGDDPIKAPLQRLSSLTSDLQDAVMRARMQPIGRLFSNLPRLVRDLAGEVGKKIELVTSGSDTELDRQLIELIRDPITHMIRNCADHGIEPPAERRAAGKPEAGTIQVSAAHEAGHINIVVSDDGRGLDVGRIRAKVRSLALAGEAELTRMGDDEVCAFIFAPGFSTARQVTNISGRGVGMDVVRENIEAIGGTVALSTVMGRGTSFTLKIPLTLAIAPALIVEAAGNRFALPQHAVLEAVSTGPGSSGRIERVHDALVLRLRDDVLPVVDLGRLLRLKPAQKVVEKDQLVVVMRIGSLTFGVIVDAVSDVQEIVVKPLGASLTRLPMFSGNTILGDGSVVLILDPHGVAASLGLDGSNNFSVAAAQQEFTPPREPTRLILFRAGSGTLKALPLSLVARIETISGAQVVTADGITVTQHQGRLMPLVTVGGTDYQTGTQWPVLVVGVGGEPMGLLVSEIVDIVEDYLDIQIAGANAGTIGTANIRGEPTDILDVAHYMRLARPEAFERGHARRFHVLLVDDKQFFRDMLTPVISAAGFEVTTVASGREALALFGKGAIFDAVITDIDMPEMDGYALAYKILEDPQRRSLPILALDAHAAPAVRRAAEAAGMRGAVGKFDRAALVAALAAMLDATAFNKHAIESRVIAEAAA